MSQQLQVALVRAILGGVIKAGTVFFSVLAAGAGTTGSISHSVLVIAAIGAGGAFFAELVVRFGAEGLIDTAAANNAGGPGAWQVAPVRSMNDMGLISRLIVAAAIAVIVWLVCVFFGGLLAMTGAPLMAYVGRFIETWAVLIAVIAFVLAFFNSTGWSWPIVRRTPPPAR